MAAKKKKRKSRATGVKQGITDPEVRRRTTEKIVAAKKKTLDARRERYKANFLKVFEKCKNVGKSCKAIDVDRWTIHKWKKADPEFSRKWDEIKERVIDDIETSGQQRASEGWLEPVYFQGEKVGHIRKYSDTLTKYFLTYNRKKTYGADAAFNKDPSEIAREILTSIQGMNSSIPKEENESSE